MLRRNRRRGFTTAEVLIVTGILTALGGGNSFQNVTNKAHQVTCYNQLRQLGLSFMMMAHMDEPLPQAWFYPPDNHPAREQYNIVNIMARQRVPKQFFICPSAPEELKARGCCYLYNDRLSNRNLDSIDRPGETWLMMDVNAVTSEVPPAHNEGCNVLFCDGHVKWMPASAIPNLMQQAVDFQGQ
ncbi:MAG: prepilin-type N-terminal cleavage/methylation domain-containing protein [Armatimonadota bacterium]